VLKRIADFCYRRRWRVLFGWIAIFVLVNVLAASVGSSFSQTFNLPSTDSQKAFDLLDRKFPARAGKTAFVVFKAPSSLQDPASQTTIEDVVAKVRQVPDVAAVRSPLEPDGKLLVSPTKPIAMLATRASARWASRTALPKSAIRRRGVG
jgi:RND superfamily putative drug exporter